MPNTSENKLVYKPPLLLFPLPLFISAEQYKQAARRHCGDGLCQTVRFGGTHVVTATGPPRSFPQHPLFAQAAEMKGFKTNVKKR